MSRIKDKKKKSRFLMQPTSNTDNAYKVYHPDTKVESGENVENHASKKLRNKKRKNSHTAKGETVERDKLSQETEDGLGEQLGGSDEQLETKKRKRSKKKTRKDKKVRLDKMDSEAEDDSEQQNDDENIETAASGTQNEIEKPEEPNETDFGKSRKAKKKKNTMSSDGEEKLLQKTDAKEDEIYQISSGDEDCSKGMKTKWIMEYHQRRPGIDVVQKRIDEFTTGHEAQEEQERKEREALAAEDGWTVVTHSKGRKKTTDAETGVPVGSVSQAGVLDKMTKKKSKEVALDFYRFQKREAHRNEIMMLQDKFEQDKKRIQQLRAARKFRPY